ncbi:hypothetical protein BT96DRAFT_792882, partial [Gymnopus androsaceus JB14]
PDMLMFIDEAAHNAKTSVRKYGHATQGCCCVQWRQFVCGDQVSILLAITLNGLVAYNIIPGSVTS